MEYHIPKAIKILTIIFCVITSIILAMFFYIPFLVFKYPSKDVYICAIIFPIMLVITISLLVINYKVLNRCTNVKLRKGLVIFNYILFPIVVIGSIVLFFISGANGFCNGYSYTEDYSNYSKIIENEDYYMFHYLPEFSKEEVASFKYYYDVNDAHQEDLFIELKYNDFLTYNNRLSSIKNGLGEYLVVTNPLNTSYTDILLKEKDNSFEVIDYNSFFEVKGSYFSISYNDEMQTIIITRLIAPSDLFVNEHNPFIFKYFNYECKDSFKYKT